MLSPFQSEMVYFSRWSEDRKLSGGLSSGPVVFFDEGSNVVILSPFNNFMASSFSCSNTSVSWGVMGDVDDIPEGFIHETILYYGQKGINKVS